MNRPRSKSGELCIRALTFVALCGCNDAADSATAQSIAKEIQTELANEGENKRAEPEAANSSIEISAGFKPDPIVHVGSFRADKAASSFAPHCTGAVGNELTIQLNAKMAFAQLRFEVESETPIGLVLRTADGVVHCSKKLERKTIMTKAVQSGVHEIWISGEPSKSPAYRLSISELPQ